MQATAPDRQSDTSAPQDQRRGSPPTSPPSDQHCSNTLALNPLLLCKAPLQPQQGQAPTHRQARKPVHSTADGQSELTSNNDPLILENSRSRPSIRKFHR